jgi:hypothetical protein
VASSSRIMSSATRSELMSNYYQPGQARLFFWTDPLGVSPRSHVAHTCSRRQPVIVAVDQPAAGPSATGKGNSRFATPSADNESR